VHKQNKLSAVFLDRDGTINIEKEYLCRVEDFEFIPGAPEAIKKLKDAGFLVIVVTNQSGVARGYFGIDDVHDLHDHMQRELTAFGTSIDAFYLCPHHPEEGKGVYRCECECRKGAPGLLLQASADYAIDLESSYMIGDKLTDVEAGERAGCTPIMVMTGYGNEGVRRLDVGRARVCDDLSVAAELILELSSLPE
jgi:D-glycero-D-manno-heptose 1,7-bisphosphate phosphatase